MGVPRGVRNPLSALGAAIATTMAIVLLVLLLLESVGAITNPYVGLLVFIAIPLVFVLGLLLIPIGAWWSRRRRRQDPLRAEWPVLDLGRAKHRNVAMIVGTLTIVNIAIVSMAAYGGVHYMDSAAFCGQVCHTTMEPQYASSQVWPHAEVECTTCHVGPGAGAAVQAKMAGTRQLYHLVTNQVPKPVPSPESLVRPARDTCQHCHWSNQRHGDRPRVIYEYANDERNSETLTKLQLHVGTGRTPGRGIHWHADSRNVIEFVPGDGEDGEVPYVRLTDGSGQFREYVRKGQTAEAYASTPRRRMDCTDCHNRPAHTMFATAERAADTALADGRIPRDLPFVRRETVAALKGNYPDRETGLGAIARHFTQFYAGRNVPPQRVRQAIGGAQELWSRNVFPAMRVTWGTYRNNLGHIDSPGCFRCHDDEHQSRDGRTIRQDCELCHTAPE